MEPFIGEIQIFPYNFAPRSWAFCDGQLLPISQYTELFSIIGIGFGGNSQTNFALPDLRGRAPMHWGAGPGLTQRTLGQQTGEAGVTLTTAQLPSHTHAVQADATQADQATPTSAEVLAEGHAPSRGGGKQEPLYVTSASNATMNGNTVAMAGGQQPHDNMQPYLALNFCIALQGLYPTRS